MLLSNAMVDMLVEKIRGLHDFNLTELKEKNVTDGKVKLVFKRNSLKTSVEFGTKEMSAVVYDNFIKPEHREQLTFIDFHKEFLGVLNNQDRYKDMKSIEKAVNELCEQIIATKLKFPKSEPVITEDKPKKRTRKTKKELEAERAEQEQEQVPETDIETGEIIEDEPIVNEEQEPFEDEENLDEEENF